jgi:hypothetical protein
MLRQSQLEIYPISLVVKGYIQQIFVSAHLRTRQSQALQCQTKGRICKRLRSPGVDSKESIPLAYVAQRAGTITLFVVLPRQAT